MLEGAARRATQTSQAAPGKQAVEFDLIQMAGPKVFSAPGPAIPQRKVDQAAAAGSVAADGPRAIQASFISRKDVTIDTSAECSRLAHEDDDCPLEPQGAGKGKRVTTRSPEAAAQSGDALAVVGGGAQNTAEARVTSAQAPAEAAVVKQEAGSGTAAGVRVAPLVKWQNICHLPFSSSFSETVLAQVKLPLEVGTRLRCRWRDGSWHDARIIERRPLPDAQSDTDYEYYVHYERCETLFQQTVGSCVLFPAVSLCNLC